MKSLKVINGDIVFDSLGKLSFVSGGALIIQSLNLKLKTLKGELFYNKNYGHPVLKGKYDKETILSYLKNTLMDDNRILDIEIVDYNLNQISLDINVLIYLKSNETINTILSA